MDQSAQGNSAVTIPGSVKKKVQIRHLRTWFNSEHAGGAGFTVGSHDLKGLIQL